MAVTRSKLFQPVQLGTSLGTLFTISTTLPPGTLLIGGRVRLVNTSSNPVAVEMDAVPNGGTAGVSNQLVPTNYAVPANGWTDVDLPVMTLGDFLQAKAGTASVITAHFMSGGLFS